MEHWHHIEAPYRDIQTIEGWVMPRAEGAWYVSDIRVTDMRPRGTFIDGEGVETPTAEQDELVAALRARADGGILFAETIIAARG